MQYNYLVQYHSNFISLAFPVVLDELVATFF